MREKGEGYRDRTREGRKERVRGKERWRESEGEKLFCWRMKESKRYFFVERERERERAYFNELENEIKNEVASVFLCLVILT